MSVQAFLTRWYLRSRFKPRPGAVIRVAEARARMARLDRWQMPLPQGVQLQAVPAQPEKGLCPAEWLSVNAPELPRAIEDGTEIELSVEVKLMVEFARSVFATVAHV